MVAGPASGDFAEYRLEARDIRQAARKSTTAANASTAARRPARTALPRAGRRQKLSDSRSLG
jgi:hypothetical protein